MRFLIMLYKIYHYNKVYMILLYWLKKKTKYSNINLKTIKTNDKVLHI